MHKGKGLCIMVGSGWTQKGSQVQVRGRKQVQMRAKDGSESYVIQGVGTEAGANANASAGAGVDVHICAGT